jgi:hypothetical protein
MNIKHKKLIVLDCGKNESTIYDGKSCKRLSHREVLNLPNILEEGTLLVSEVAHLSVPRTMKSLAQPFTQSELQTLYKGCRDKGIKLSFFPQKSTPRAQKYSNLEKSDETDPVAIYNLLQDFEQISLMNPRESFSVSPVRQEGWGMKSHMNSLLNFARRYEYKHELDENSQWIRYNIEKLCARLSNEAKSCFGLGDDSRYKRKNSKLGVEAGDMNFNNKNLKINQIYAVLSTLQGKIVENGEMVCIVDEPIVRDSTKNLAGWGFAKTHLLCMSPNHMRGGVARSNLYYHGAKNWIIARSKEEGVMLAGKNRGEFSQHEDQTFLKYRRMYTKSIKELFMAIKSILES